jgi:AraC-like DNA-binding protein
MNETIAYLPGLSPVENKEPCARFDGGRLSSDGGVLLLRGIEKRLGLAARLASCLTDTRDPASTTHSYADLIVETLARHAGMSPRTFARLYKERTGITPAKSVEMMRVDAAKQLLEQTATALAEVALRTGLVDEQRLRRAFLRHVGVSPHEYRRTFGTQSG